MESTLTTLNSSYEEPRKFPRGVTVVGSFTQHDVLDSHAAEVYGSQPARRGHLLLIEQQHIEKVVAMIGIGSTFNALNLHRDLILGAPTSPFDDLFDAEKLALIGVLRRLGAELDQPFAQSLSQRLEELARYGYEDEPDQVPISPDSVENLIALFRQFPRLARPSMVITPSRNIQVQWGKQSDRKLVVELLSNYQARFIVFSRDLDRPERINRVSGSISTKHILDAVRPFGALDWILAEEYGQRPNPRLE